LVLDERDDFLGFVASTPFADDRLIVLVRNVKKNDG